MRDNIDFLFGALNWAATWGWNYMLNVPFWIWATTGLAVLAIGGVIAFGIWEERDRRRRVENWRRLEKELR